ncbi:MAG: hypothetical protein R3D30_10490 [Hyphomicrobiales bacterium]
MTARSSPSDAGNGRRATLAGSLAKQGKLGDAQDVLVRTRSSLGEMANEACPGLADRIAGQLDDIDKDIAPLKAKAETALAQCQFGEGLSSIGGLPTLQRQALMEQWDKALATGVAGEGLAQ